MAFSVKFGILAAAVASIALTTCRSTEPAVLGRLGDSRVTDTVRSRLRDRIGASTAAGRFNSSLHYARQMLNVAADEVSGSDETFALICIGQSSFFMGSYDTASLYFNRALYTARSRNDEWGVGAAYNGLGLVAVCARMDYYEAFRCFTASVEALENSTARVLYHVAMANLALTCWRRDDPSGLPYASEVLDYGRKRRDSVQIFYGTYACAAIHYLLGDYTKALGYIEETTAMADKFYDVTGVYTLSANILRAAGKPEKAAEHYRIAALRLNDAEATSASDYYLGYGQFLVEQKRYRDAAGVLQTGVAAARRTGNTVGRHLFYRELSLVYRRLGRLSEALDCYEIFHAESDSIFNVERERSLSEMHVKYETEKRQKEFREKQYEVLREKRRVQTTGLIAAAIAAVLLAVWILYKRKNALYLRIVSQYQDAIRREKALSERCRVTDTTGGGNTRLRRSTAEKALYCLQT